MPVISRKGVRRACCMMLLALLVVVGQGVVASGPAWAVRVLVVVNDKPITDFDVRQRMRLHRLLGMRFPSRGEARKRALQSLIDNIVLESEARTLGLVASEHQVEAAIRRMASGMGGMERLKSALKRAGLRMSAVRDFVRGQILFQLVSARMGKKVSAQVGEADVERRLKKILSDPRLRPITVWRLRQVTLPVEDAAPVMRDQLLLARAVEARQIMQRYAGCSSLPGIARDIFNVQVSKVLDADPGRLPKPLREALRKAGTRQMVGPIRAPQGIQLLAFCGTRTIKPRVPDKNKLRQQIRASLRQERMSREIERIMTELREKAVIEHKRAAR